MILRTFAVSVLLALAATLSGCSPPWRCDSSTCANGCCNPQGTCVISGGARECGLRGNACAACETCTNGVCGCPAGLELAGSSCTCKPSSCTGCCDTNSTGTRCRLPSTQDDGKCGIAGETCRACQTFETCGSAGCQYCLRVGDACSISNDECCSSSYCSYDSSTGGYRCR